MFCASRVNLKGGGDQSSGFVPMQCVAAPKSGRSTLEVTMNDNCVGASIFYLFFLAQR